MSEQASRLNARRAYFKYISVFIIAFTLLTATDNRPISFYTGIHLSNPIADTLLNIAGNAVVALAILMLLISGLIPLLHFRAHDSGLIEQSGIDGLAGNGMITTIYATYLNLNKRIDDLRSRSTLIYWTIIGTLLSGVVLIVFVGRLATLDSTLSLLQSNIESEKRDLIRAEGLSDQEFDRRFNFDDPTVQREVLRQKSERSTNLRELQDKLDAELAKIDDAIIAKYNSDSGLGKSLNWPNIILRLSVIGLLVFLTQILISLYRYNSRLLAFYVARRDAIVVGAGQPEMVVKLIEIFYPKTLDFGKEPRHPFAEFGDILHQIQETVKDLRQRMDSRTRTKNAKPEANTGNG